MVVGTPLDFRLGQGEFGGRTGPRPPRWYRLMPGPDRHPFSLAPPPRATWRRSSPRSPLSTADRGARACFARPGGVGCPWPRPPRAEAVAADGALPPTPTPSIRYIAVSSPGCRRGRGGDRDGDFAPTRAIPRAQAPPAGWLDPGLYGCLVPPGYGIAARTRARRHRWCCCRATARRAFADGRRFAAPIAGRHDLRQQRAWGLEKHPVGPVRVRRGGGPAAALPLRRGGPVEEAEIVTRLDGIALPAPAFGWGALPGERHHRPRDRLPPLHHRHLTLAA